MASLLPFVRVERYKDLLGICIAPPPHAPSEPKDFHIAFVIDVSGSMEGDRLETVQRTMHLFVDQMREGADRVSLITYSSSARLLCSGCGESDLLHKHISALHAEGGTNMETAIYALMETDLSTVDAVFLLTDGEVNQGIRTTAGLESLLRSTVRGIPVYTLGYGDSHNAELLQALATMTRASYTYAEHNEMIPSVVGAILVAMREEVAKGVELQWEGEGAAARCWELGAKRSDRTYHVGSLIANKPQWILLGAGAYNIRLKAAGAATAAADPVDLPLPLPLPLADAVESADVLEQWIRIRAATVFAEIRQTGQMLALVKLQQLEDEVQAALLVQGRPLVCRILAEIAEQREHYDNVHLHHHNQHNRHGAARAISHMTALMTQRGVIPEFNSPSQRLTSDTMVHHFQSQDPC